MLGTWDQVLRKRETESVSALLVAQANALASGNPASHCWARESWGSDDNPIYDFLQRKDVQESKLISPMHSLSVFSGGVKKYFNSKYVCVRQKWVSAPRFIFLSGTGEDQDLRPRWWCVICSIWLIRCRRNSFLQYSKQSFIK